MIATIIGAAFLISAVVAFAIVSRDMRPRDTPGYAAALLVAAPAMFATLFVCGVVNLVKRAR